MENITFSGINKNILYFIYVAAMRDATNRAFEGERKWLCDKTVFEKIYRRLNVHIKKILENGYKDQDDYDNEFFDLSKFICSEINKEKNERQKNSGEFSFGNAQKLINMTVKYIFITTFGDRKVSRDIFNLCHCPMDGKMLETVWKNKNKLDGIDLGSSCFYSDGWGKEKTSDTRYATFQKAIRQLAEKDECSPIEYDYKHWN